MKILTKKEFVAVTESIKSELFKNGMCVEYSIDGEYINYIDYIILTDKEDIKKSIKDLKWPQTFTQSDKSNMLNDKYGIFIASKETGAIYVCISDIIINNILYIWNTDIKFSDCIKDKYIIDISDKCTQKNIIYEKDVDFSKIVTGLVDYPYYNYGWQPEDWSSLSRGCDAWTLNHTSNRHSSIKQPNPKFI